MDEVGGSWITVKEQMAGLYADLLSRQGFATLAFDFRYFGESGGEPRQLESCKAKTQDFKNVMTFLKSLPMVDKRAFEDWRSVPAPAIWHAL